MNKFEEYKLFVEDTAKFSERRQTVNNTYVAVNSIILTAISFLVKDAQLPGPRQSVVVILLLTAGIVICDQWIRIIRKYKKLVSFRIDHLRQIELDMAGCHQMYHKEDDLYPRDSITKKVIAGEGLNFSDRERWLPSVFMCIYAIFLFGIFYFLLRPIPDIFRITYSISFFTVAAFAVYSIAVQSEADNRKRTEKMLEAVSSQG